MSEDLSRPVPGEAENLALHVEMCARRHGAIERRHDDTDRRLKRIEITHYAAAALIVTAITGGAVTVRDIVNTLHAVAQIADATPAPAPPRAGTAMAAEPRR